MIAYDSLFFHPDRLKGLLGDHHEYPFFLIPKPLITLQKHLSIKDKRSFLFFYISFIFHLSVFKYNLIKIWRFKHFVQSMFNDCFFINVFYNALLHRWNTTRNKFLTKIFAVAMPSYLTFATANINIKLPSHFFPNSHSCQVTKRSLKKVHN